MKQIEFHSIRFSRSLVTYRAELALMHSDEKAIGEYHAYLSPAECLLYDSYLQKRQFEFLGGRMLGKLAASRLFAIEDLRSIEISKGVFGYPLLHVPGYPNKGISISHKENLFATIVYDEAHPIGLDLEMIDELKLDVLKSQAVVDEESCRSTVTCNDIIFYTILWSAKEALSKVLKCGLTIPLELLITKKIHQKDAHTFEGEFCNFFQYRFFTKVVEKNVITLVFPRKSEIFFE